MDQIVFYAQHKNVLVKLGVETCTSNLKVEKCVGGRCHCGLNEFRSESFEYNGLSTKKKKEIYYVVAHGLCKMEWVYLNHSNNVSE